MPRARALSAGWRIPHPIVCIADPDYSCDPLAPVRTVLAVYGEQDLPSDPQWASTQAILPLDEGLTDYSPGANVFNLVGDAVLSTTHARYGSVTYENAGSDGTTCLLSAAGYLSYDPVTSPGADLVVEVSALMTSKATSQVLAYVPGGYKLWYDHTVDEIKLSGTVFTIGTSYSPALNQWVDYAIIQRGNDTVNLSDSAFADGSTLITTSGAAWIGSFTNQPVYFGGDGALPLVGAMCQCRITVTVPAHSGRIQEGTAYTVPPFELPQGLHPTLHDCSCANPKTVTLAGYATPQETYRAVGRDLVYAPSLATNNNTPNGIVVTGHADFDFGVDDFGIEFFAERLSHAREGFLFWYEETGGEFSVSAQQTSGEMRVTYCSSGGTQTHGLVTVFPLNTPRHVAVQKRTIAGVPYWETYLHGVLADQTAVTGGAASTVNLAGDWYFGRKNVSSPNPINGAIGQLHVVRGRAPRTGNFTPPTLPFCCHG